MGINDTGTFSPEALEAAERFMKNLESGKLAKRVLPNGSDSFSEERALQSFKALVRSDMALEAERRSFEARPEKESW